MEEIVHGKAITVYLQHSILYDKKKCTLIWISIFITALADPSGETSDMVLGLVTTTYSVVFYNSSALMDHTERTD